MVLVQKWPCFQLFFLGNIGQKNVVYDILERKDAFLGYKNKEFKKWKSWHFSKGVNPWFRSKNGHFWNFFFGRKYRPEKYPLRYSRARKRLFKAIKTISPKSGKIDLSPIVLVQKWPFFHLFFLDNIGLENVFYDILERKNAFLGYKNKKFKRSRNCNFSMVSMV